MEKELEEIIISERKALELDMEDKDLAKEIDTRILEIDDKARYPL